MQRYDDFRGGPRSPSAEFAFTRKIEAALTRIRTLLDRTRNPTFPADVPHAYEDKYLLVEFVTRVANASALQCLELVGLSSEGLDELRGWAADRTVTLRLSGEESCRYDREETRKVESPEIVTETRGTDGSSIKSEKIVAKIVEHFWIFDFSYEIVAYRGNEPERAVALLTRKGSFEIKTPAKQTPRPTAVVRQPVEVDVSWLLRHLDADGRPAFAIDRTNPKCHTPRRNPDVDAALDAFVALRQWCVAVTSYFVSQLFPAQPNHGRDLSAITGIGIFVPVVTFFEAATTPGESLLPASYATALLDEERRSLSERCRALATAFPKDGTAITAVEAGLIVTVLHLQEVAERLFDAVAYVEDMLRQQLIAAIGKEVMPSDFGAYMDFHHRKLVKEAYRPRPFSYAVRRVGHDPEGVVGIEAQRTMERGDGMAEPISTIVSSSAARRPMTFALDASTRVAFLGERHVHAWVGHRFSGDAGLSAELVARARQFSSFVLLVGRITSADTFEPRFGVVLRNKDALRIPLLLEDIPTPKQFRDAIESLSPEQQRFAKAFRGMQLESTLFGVVVLHIKPQLEKLLGLPADSLTKEIQLTEDLLGLFSEYQIPSDLLSYDGPEDAPATDKVARVASYAGRMHEMIAKAKQRELDEAREREAKRVAELNQTMQMMRSAPSTGYPIAPPGYGAPPPPMSAPMFAMAAPGGFGPPPAAGFGGPPPPPAPAPPAPAMPQAPAARSAPVDQLERGGGPDSATSAARDVAAPRTAGSERGASSTTSAGGAELDYTSLPTALDRSFEALDEDAALHSTILHAGDTWSRTAQRGLLSDPETESLDEDEQLEEKQRAFDLLDALTKSGALAIEDAALHVVLAATHAFDKTLLETVIQDNVNPIEKVERSLLIVGGTIFGLPPSELIADDQRERVLAASPRLLGSSPSRHGSDG